MKALRRGQVASVSGLDATFESSCLLGPVAPGRELADITASFSDTGILLHLYFQFPGLDQSLFPCETLTLHWAVHL